MGGYRGFFYSPSPYYNLRISQCLWLFCSHLSIILDQVLPSQTIPNSYATWLRRSPTFLPPQTIPNPYVPFFLPSQTIPTRTPRGGRSALAHLPASPDCPKPERLAASLARSKNNLHLVKINSKNYASLRNLVTNYAN